MKKAEVIKYIKEKAAEGWVSHSMLLEIFDDEEDIPDEFVELVCHKPEPPRQIMMTMSQELFNAFNQACEDWWDAIKQENHAKESIKKVSKS